MSTPVINDQLDDMNDKLEAIVEAIGDLPFNGVPEAVADWLDDHPEATTTVQDGAITDTKLASALHDAIFKPKKHAVVVLAEDSHSAGMINIGKTLEIGDELVITVYQSDTANYGEQWSTNPSSNYWTIRDTSSTSATGYVQGMPSGTKGDKSVMMRLKRLRNCIYCTLKNGDEAEKVSIIQRDPSYTDTITWVSIDANTNHTLKAGAVVEAILKRM